MSDNHKKLKKKIKTVNETLKMAIQEAKKKSLLSKINKNAWYFQGQRDAYKETLKILEIILKGDS